MKGTLGINLQCEVRWEVYAFYGIMDNRVGACQGAKQSRL